MSRQSKTKPNSEKAKATVDYREKLTAIKSEMADDWRLLRPDTREKFTPYGYLALDYGLRLQGLAGNGRVVHTHGPEGGGKSTAAYCIASKYQRQVGRPVAIFDYERTLSNEYVEALGLDKDLLIIYRPDSIETGVRLTMKLIEEYGVGLCIYDSIPRMTPTVDPKLIENGKAFKDSVGRHARSMQFNFYDILLPHWSRLDVNVIMINQTRARIDSSQAAMWAQKYPSFTNLSYVLPGGKANRHAASVMLELTTKKAFRAGSFDGDDFVIEPGDKKGRFVAVQSAARVLKNKVTAGGYRAADLWFRPGRGIDDNITIRQLARQYGLIASTGKRWYVGENADNAIKVYDAKDAAIEDLVVRSNPDVLLPLRKLVIAKIEADKDGFNIDVEDGLAKYLDGDETGDADIDAVTANVLAPPDEELI